MVASVCEQTWVAACILRCSRCRYILSLRVFMYCDTQHLAYVHARVCVSSAQQADVIVCNGLG